jgi:hypothetical protein
MSKVTIHVFLYCPGDTAQQAALSIVSELGLKIVKRRPG